MGGALAQPAGPSVIAGQAQVSSSGATTFVNQSTSKAIINWQDFSVGAGATVQFNQPNAAAITLNRVTGANISTIDGAIRANGQVWLLNPNGLLFGNGAVINVGGLLATTSDIANQDFLDGRYNFSGGRNAITNNGAISAANGGSVILSAPSVTNRGLIQANAGHVVLGGTDTFTVDFNGDRLLSYAVGSNSQGGTVANSGKIQAQGGKVLLTARAAAGVQDAVINNSGMIEATSAREENGEIILDAGDGGVVNSGSLDASGKGAGETGGTDKVLGQQVAVADGAKIDVSGDAGGGTVLIGGNFHGAGPEQNAQNTTVGKASIKADAITSGNGGKVAVWSDGTTRFAGSISTRGGVQSGDGGRVETSGHTLSVDKAATVATAAPYGVAGNWLLDPDFIIVATGGGASDTGQTFSTTGTVTIDPLTIAASLNAGSNVQLQANFDITVSNTINATGSTLELDAGRSVILNAAVALGSGTLILFAGDSAASGGSLATAAITQSSGSITAGSLTATNQLAAGAITLGITSNAFSSLIVNANGGAAAFADGSSVSLTANTSGGNVSINDTGGISIVGASTTGNLTLTAAGATVTQSSPITANNLSVTADSGATLTNAGNNVSGTVSFDVTFSGNVSFANSASTTTLGNINTNGSNLTISTAGAITQAAATSIGANNLTVLGIPSSVTLSNAGNAVTGTVTLNAGSSGGIAFSNSVTTNLAAIGPVNTLDIEVSGSGAPAININGVLQATGFVTLNATGGIQTSGPGLSAPTITLMSNGGSIGLNGTAIPVKAPSGTLSLSVSNTGSGGSAYLTSTSPVTVTSGSLSGGTFDLETVGDLTVNSPITTFSTDANPSSIVLLSQGSLILNANVTDTYNDVTIPNSAIFLAANNGASSGGTASISGTSTGVVSAANVAIQLFGDATTVGSIGTSGSPLALGTSGANLEIRTNGQNAFISSGGAVNIFHVDGTLGITGVQLTDGAGAFGDFSLTAAGLITQSDVISANNFTVSTTGSGHDIVLSGNTIIGTSRFNTAPGSNVSYTSTNSIAVTLGNSNVGGALDIEATSSDQSITLSDNNTGIVSVGGLLTLNSGSAISQAIPIIAGSLTASSINGNVTLTHTSNSIPGTITLSSPGDVSLVNGGPTILGTISAGGSINLDTGGSIVVNGSVTSTSSTSTIVLTANDSTLSGNADSNGITGSGLLTADYINLSASSGQNGLSGSIGNPGQLLQVTSFTTPSTPLSLALRTYNSNAYINSAVAVSIDDQRVVLQNGAAAAGINTQGSNTFYGEVNLTAGGPISQTYGIQSGNLTLNSVGSNGAITLTDTGQVTNPDPGNTVFGILHLNSSGNAAYSAGSGNASSINLGASTVSGNLTVSSAVGDINVQDPNGGIVNVGGVMQLVASNGISINSPLVSGSNMTLVADRGVNQGSGSGNAHIQVGGNLAAQSLSGPISLTDPGNQVSGIAILNGTGDVVLAASSSLTLGTVTASGGGKIKILSGGDLTIASGTVLSSSLASGYSIQLSAGGNFINNAGANALSMPSGANFAIFSAAPAGDVFGGLNSGNTAYWGTTYASIAGTTPPHLGNRYVFAIQPTLTVSTSSASKVYGVDDSASLQTGYTVSGLQPGVSGAYLADTVSSVFGTAAQAISVGSAATANVGTYAITVSNNNPANDYIPANGYAIVAQNGTLTVTPATLAYVANTAARAFGAANAAFSGNVTGFVNGDTLASATSGALVFATAATAASPVGSYAINGSGLSAANYLFTQAPGNATALTINPATTIINPATTLDTQTVTDLISFTASLQTPPLNPLLVTILGNDQTALNAPPPPPPPPPLLPPNGPLADLAGPNGSSSEPPSSSDQVTDEVAASLDGGNAPPADVNSGPVIPKMLTNSPPPPPPPTDISALPSFGNASLWQ
jgi:filamentous hemagglutinin family protein